MQGWVSVGGRFFSCSAAEGVEWRKRNWFGVFGGTFVRLSTSVGEVRKVWRYFDPREKWERRSEEAANKCEVRRTSLPFPGYFVPVLCNVDCGSTC